MVLAACAKPVRSRLLALALFLMHTLLRNGTLNVLERSFRRACTWEDQIVL